MKRVFDSKAKSLENSYRERVSLAHQTATLVGFAFHDPKNMPKLDKLLKPERATGPQTPEEAFEIVRMLNAIHGGTVEK